MHAERRMAERRAAERRLPAAPAADICFWQASTGIIGFTVLEGSGRLGRVKDFRYEEESAAITDLVIAARGRGRKPLFVPLSAVARIDWQARTLYLR
jgi:hypothetical protein